MILNTDRNYDSELCGSIPLNFINHIQSHGLLLVVDKQNFKILQLSDNITTFFGLEVEAFLNKPLSAFIDQKSLEDIQQKIERWTTKQQLPFTVYFTANEKKAKFDLLINNKLDYLILEFEENNQQSQADSFIKIYQETKYVTAALKEVSHLEEFGNIAVKELKQISWFDRVMLYKFDAEWNGTVIAEAREEDMEPYLGLRFPASDVPKQARELYLRNPYRIIPNINYKPSRLYPIINPTTNNYTDLSDSVLRSVPGVHIEYLQNMGVTASMSTAIIKNNTLWGLISCHHKSAKYLSFELRSAFELISDIIAAQLISKETEATLIAQSRSKDIYSNIIAKMYADSDFRTGLLQNNPNLLDLLNLSGAVIMLDGEYVEKGNVPENHEVKELARWLQRQNIEDIYATHELPRLYDKSIKFKDLASGIIVIPISMKRGDMIIGLRNEILKTINWGGNPNEAINFEPDGKHYHPRNSFALWKETVKYTSLPWQEQEIEAARQLRTAVLALLLAERY